MLMNDFTMTDGARADVAALLADPAKQAAARTGLQEQLEAAPTTLSYVTWSRQLPDLLTKRRIALLSPFTVETIAPFLSVECYLSKWAPEIDCHQYSLWQSVLIDPAGLAEDTQAVILLLDERSAIDGLGGTAAEAAMAIGAMIDGFRKRNQVPLFLGLVPAIPNPHAPALGLAEAGARLGRLQAVNAALAEAASRHPRSWLIDIPGALAAVGTAWHDPAAYQQNLSFISHSGMPALARCIARSLAGLFLPRHKVLVTDLDETLWGGVVGEVGAEGVATGEKGKGRFHLAYQRFLAGLRGSGVLLAINSKNNEGDAREVFETRGTDMALAWDHFSAHRVNWADKASNLAEIADELGLGLDSFVFVDDSPTECELIRQMHPGVTVVEAARGAVGLVEQVLATRAFDALAISSDDQERAERYKTERLRDQMRGDMGDMTAFLKSLDLTLTLHRLNEDNADRIHQLLNKTNQFHLTLERPELADLLVRGGDRNEIYAAGLRDRFGDYGIVAVMELEPEAEAVRIRNLAISCRALGRGVEAALTALAGERGRAMGRVQVEARFVEGARNQLVPPALEQAGFARDEASGDYRLPLDPSPPCWPEFVRREVEH